MFHDHKHAWNRVGYRHDSNGRPDPYHKANLDQAKQIWYKLQEHYPGHPWEVASNIKQGIAQIKLPTFTEWSFVIRLSDLYGDPSMRVVIKGAGEFLERYNIPRAGFDVAHYLVAQQKFRPRFNMGKLAS